MNTKSNRRLLTTLALIAAPFCLSSLSYAQMGPVCASPQEPFAECDLQLRGNETILNLRNDVTGTDSFGLDARCRGGTFDQQTAFCDGQFIKFEKFSENSGSLVAGIKLAGRFTNCFVQRSRSWNNLNFQCQLNGGHQHGGFDNGAWNRENARRIDEARRLSAPILINPRSQVDLGGLVGQGIISQNGGLLTIGVQAWGQFPGALLPQANYQVNVSCPGYPASNARITRVEVNNPALFEKVVDIRFEVPAQFVINPNVRPGSLRPIPRPMPHDGMGCQISLSSLNRVTNTEVVHPARR